VDQLRDLAPRGIAAFEVGEVSVEIPTGVRASLAELGRQERATPYMVLLAGFTAMLSRATGQRDVCVQSTFSLRGRSELHGMIGFVGNALIQRVDNSGNPSFRELVRRTRQVVLASWGHGESLKIDRVDHSLRRVNFNYVPIESRAYEPVELAPGTFATRLDAPADSTQVRIPWDLHLWLLDSRSSTTLRLLFLRQLFLPRTARTLLEGYVELLGEMADRPDALVHGGLR
jgi:non-ribosomal peptide synthetase component F